MKLALLLRDEEALLSNLNDLMFLLESEAEVRLVSDSEVCRSARLNDLHALPSLSAEPGHAGPAGNVQNLELRLAGWRHLGWRTDGRGVDWDQSRGWSGGSAGQQHGLAGFTSWRA